MERKSKIEMEEKAPAKAYVISQQTNNYHFIEHFDNKRRTVRYWFIPPSAAAAVTEATVVVAVAVASASNCFRVFFPFLFLIYSRVCVCAFVRPIELLLYFLSKAAH